MAEIQSSVTPAQEVDSTGVTLQTLEESMTQSILVTTERDDSVFYSEEELMHDSICGPRSAGPIWSAEHNLASEALEAEESAQPRSSKLMKAGCFYQESNTANHGLFSVTEVESETKTEAEELSTPSMKPLMMSSTVDDTQFPIQDLKKNRFLDMCSETPTELQDSVTSFTNESSSPGPDWVGVTGPPCTSSPLDGLSDVSLAEAEQKLASSTPSDSGNGIEATQDKPFNHLKHAKYGTVSYRHIRKGHTRKRIEEFESMMQL